MAFLVHDAVRGAEPALQIHSTLIEACLLRPWPGNARELVAEVSRTAHTVAAQGKNNIRGEDLDNDAGHLMVGAPTLNAAVPADRGRQAAQASARQRARSGRSEATADQRRRRRRRSATSPTSVTPSATPAPRPASQPPPIASAISLADCSVTVGRRRA